MCVVLCCVVVCCVVLSCVALCGVVNTCGVRHCVVLWCDFVTICCGVFFIVCCLPISFAVFLGLTNEGYFFCSTNKGFKQISLFVIT